MDAHPLLPTVLTVSRHSCFSAPQCYHAEERENGYWLWLEDVAEKPNSSWPLDHYELVASHLARFNGQYLTDRSLPDWEWLLTDMLRQRASRIPNAFVWDDFDAAWHEHELMQRGWTPEVGKCYSRTWAEREVFLRVLESLPRTMQHNDSGRKNLYPDTTADYRIAVIDPRSGAKSSPLSRRLDDAIRVVPRERTK